MTERGQAAPEALEAVKNDIQQAIKSLLELGIIVHDYPDEQTSKTALDLDIQHYAQDLRAISHSAVTLGDTAVPIDIVDYIDAGRNPDIYSREFIELVAKQNQFVNGKLQAMQQFNHALVAELSTAFPDIATDLENVRV